MLISNKAIIEWSIEKFANNTIKTHLINLDVESAWHPFSPTIKINQLSIKLIHNNFFDKIMLNFNFIEYLILLVFIFLLFLAVKYSWMRSIEKFELFKKPAFYSR